MTFKLRREWFKSTRSAGSSHCLEAAYGSSGEVFVRDSKSPQEGTLSFDSSTWRAFVEALKSDDIFD